MLKEELEELESRRLIMGYMRSYIIFTLLFFLIGCKQEFDDLSLDLRYDQVINKQYESTQILKIHGVTMDRNYENKIDHYTVTKPPGIDGPEVLTVSSLRKGTVFKIKKVLQCNNCFLSSPVIMEVDILSKKFNLEGPFFLYGLTIKDKNKKSTMDAKYLKIIEELEELGSEELGSDWN